DRSRLSPELLSEFRVVVEPADPHGQLHVVARVEQETIPAVIHELGDAADPAGDVRQAARHRLEVGVPDALFPDGWAEKAIGRLHEGQCVLMNAKESRPSSEVQITGEDRRARGTPGPEPV